MKKYDILILLATAALFFSSCEKNGVQEIDSPPPSGPLVRFYNFAVGGPSVNFYANDIKVTAVNSTTGQEANSGLGYAGIFPANNNYLSLSTTGNVTFKSKVPSTAAADANAVIATISGNIESGKYYSVFSSGIYDATAKASSGFVIEDVLPGIDTAFAYVRLVNTIPNEMNGFDLKAVEANTAAQVSIASATTYKNGSAFTKLPNGVYNLTSTSVNAAADFTITRNSVSFVKGNVYTIATRGNASVSGNTGLDLTRNR